MCSRFRGLQVTCIAEEDGIGRSARLAAVAVSGFRFIGRRIAICGMRRKRPVKRFSTCLPSMPRLVSCRSCWGGWPGILLHEAIGHGLEADFNRKKTSAFSNLLGKRVRPTSVRSSTMGRCRFDGDR